MTKQRAEAEEIIYRVLDEIEKTQGTHINSDYYRQIFSTMSDDDFMKFFKRSLVAVLVAAMLLPMGIVVSFADELGDNWVTMAAKYSGSYFSRTFPMSKIMF